MGSGGENRVSGDVPAESVYLDGHGLILQAGTLFSSLVGQGGEKLAGTPLTTYIAETDLDRCSRAIESAFLGTPKDIACSLKLPDGTIHHVRWLFRQVAGGVEGTILLFEPPGKASPELEAGRYRALIRAVPGYVFILDSHGRFIELHAPEFGELLFSPEVAVGKNVRDLFSPQIAEATMVAIDGARRGEVATFTYSIMVDGRKRHFDAYVAASGVDEVVIYVMDRTTDRETEEHLRKHIRTNRGKDAE
ncbi:MAG: PAS sensor protein [Methanomicrobiales archaeon 53_19]|jgi:PAS domain-containing protein|uniref:PAS domain-containing protein n=1 Tax=Methanocalculus sp. TaxID=2004547 RepID=UPI000747F9D5|nr:PAS domain-containing protein [Methanocalculus sp.]KUK69542.1 MAG: PAS sensor protein [Methanocalculus sp. 52_23]KUL03161.1 MAG: PAS sensor protein [Methanomicrobiales archaeon 53_19]HIJ07323.1 hypothetical protein [Methanocalculus sp.]